MNNEGIGLGLTIVKQIIEKAGGNIQVLSPGLGYGSTFVFSMKMKMLSDTAVSQQPSQMIIEESVGELDLDFDKEVKNYWEQRAQP